MKTAVTSLPYDQPRPAAEREELPAFDYQTHHIGVVYSNIATLANYGRAKDVSSRDMLLRCVGRARSNDQVPLFRFTQHLGTSSLGPSPFISFLALRLHALFIPPMSEHPPLTTQPSLDSQNKPRSVRVWAKEAWIHITKHVGIGIICAVAYFDPYVPFFSYPFCPGSHTQSSFPVEIGASIYKQAQNLATSSYLSYS